jgi:hypothetical protein
VPTCPMAELEEEAEGKVMRSRFVVSRRSLSGGRHEGPVGPDPGFTGHGFGTRLKLRACVAACGGVRLGLARRRCAGGVEWPGLGGRCLG